MVALGRAAFEHAKEQDKPVLVSIGYSSCHWCHVMAHECFEDAYIADMMNRMFVCIKVDREERPDVDNIYMEAVQMLNQQGGWPLNVFCFPDGRPFTGGTYFPPDDRGHGIIPWPHLLIRVAEAFKTERKDLERNAEAIRNNLLYLSENLVEVESALSLDDLAASAATLLDGMDIEYGGFAGAPKFPPSQTLGFLLAIMRLEQKPESESLNRSIGDAFKQSVKGLISGGLFDHVGGGFYRYSVDEKWRVPHFEKMLYDNALILEVLGKIEPNCPDDAIRIKHAIFRTIDWLEREFELEEGVFAASMDADTEEGEGAFYMWRAEELEPLLPVNLQEEFLKGFEVHGSDAHNLYPWTLSEQQYLKMIPLLDDLLEVRSSRLHPAVDRKIILSWNSLMLRALVVLAVRYCNKSLLLKARKGLDWLWSRMRDDSGQLSSVFYESSNEQFGSANLDDTVNFALANLYFAGVAEWLEAGLSVEYSMRAKELCCQILGDFSDPNSEGFFYTSEKGSSDLIVRKKEWFDNAQPSGNSSIVHLFGMLAVVDEDGGGLYEKKLSSLAENYADKVRRIPNGVTYGLEGFAWHHSGYAVIKVGNEVNLDPVFEALSKLPYRPFQLAIDTEMDKTCIQLCIGNTCGLPTSNIEEGLKGF
jgi:uncharacterized protein YyaL (SSP411 family)